MGLEKATPFNYARGTLDNSAVALSVLPKTYPQFLPVFFLDTQRGGYGTRRLSGNLVDALYGADTLNPLAKYANHASVFAAGVLGAAGQIMLKRLPFLGATGDGRATMTIWVNITTAAVVAEKYTRDASGTVAKDVNGNLLYTLGSPANVKYITVSANAVPAGAATQDPTPISTVGGFDDNGTLLATTSYPIFTFKAIGHGTDYNNTGIALTAMTGANLVGSAYANKELAYALSLYYNNGNAQVIKNDTASPYTIFGTAANSVNSATLQPNGISDIFPGDYGVKPDPTGTEVVYDFENTIVHQANVDTVLGLITTHEATEATGTVAPWSDFVPANATAAADMIANSFRLANMLTNKYTSDKLYEYVRNSDTVVQTAALTNVVGNEIAPSLENPVYLSGGQDNVMTEAAYETAVLAEVANYSNPDAAETDLAINPTSAFIDSGFTLTTKLALGSFLSYRKDVMLLTSTYEVNGVNNDIHGKQLLSDAIGAATLMKSTYKLNPESVLFGTETSRAIIVLGSGKTKNVVFKKRLPLLYDLVIKLTRFAGAGNGKWNGVYKFSRQPGNFVTELIDIDPAHIGNTIKNTLWSSGLIWAQNEDRDTYFYPATQTIFTNDTSVLNILLVNVALCYLVKQEEAVWREFTGANDLTNIDLKLLGEASMNRRISEKFAGMYRIEPEIFFTQADLGRGYSYKLVAHFYANNMKTVQESYNIVNRLA